MSKSNVVDFVAYKKFKEETMRQIEESDNILSDLDEHELSGLLKFLEGLEDSPKVEYSITVEDASSYTLDNLTYSIDYPNDED